MINQLKIFWKFFDHPKSIIIDFGGVTAVVVSLSITTLCESGLPSRGSFSCLAKRELCLTPSTWWKSHSPFSINFDRTVSGETSPSLRSTSKINSIDSHHYPHSFIFHYMASDSPILSALICTILVLTFSVVGPRTESKTTILCVIKWVPNKSIIINVILYNDTN